MSHLNRVVLDTNILLNDPDFITKDPNAQTIIPLAVIQELDRKKTHPEIGFEARRAIRAIKSSTAIIDIEFPDPKAANADDAIMACAVKHGAKLVTNDYALAIKANAANLAVDEPRIEENSVYTGVARVYLSDEEMADMYQNLGRNTFNLYPNQYLLVYNAKTELVVDRLKWDGSKLVTLKLPPAKIIKPLNDLQACALDLLLDKDVPIKIIAGTYGSGKTFLNIRMALYHLLSKGTYGKILFVRNPIGSGEEIGFLKGTKDEKIGPFYKVIEQQLDGGEIQLQQMLQFKQLEYEIPFHIKGQSISNSFIIVDEAEDMNRHIIKLVGTRVAEGSCICFSGDWKQAEPKYMRDNGLVYLLNKTKTHPLAGAVVLDMDVRSSASKVFADLD